MGVDTIFFSDFFMTHQQYQTPGRVPPPIYQVWYAVIDSSHEKFVCSSPIILCPNGSIIYQQNTQLIISLHIVNQIVYDILPSNSSNNKRHLSSLPVASTITGKILILYQWNEDHHCQDK